MPSVAASAAISAVFEAEAGISDVEIEMLGHLVFVDDFADRERDLGGAAQRITFARDGGLDAGEVALGGGQQILALAAALCGEIGVAADHQAFAGKSGAVMLAMSRWSNSESCNAPPCSSALIAGARNDVIQSRPAGLMSSVMRAWVIMPRSPTSTTWSRRKRCLSLSICVASVIGSAVFPSNTSMATGQPSGAQSRP